ncbi:hypothetical protein EA473_21880 [Natrarchaeobius chitinivorans]|uniref:Uncharacterized protein n=2 Tax=Natrarchaeobius chitinivorans TaxID=1679083 RepID=A0A3N6LL95_NATCH|nr:hypothetical protein EA473_21880 [Natrarchaeobius chitinivorans]
MRPGMRTLHRIHLVRELQNDDRFDTVEFRLAEPRESGSYRVVGSTKTQWLLDDPTYPSTDARIEIGFTDQDNEYWYWFNWIEPERSFMLGWHRDGDHPDLGPAHVQINQGESVVARKSAETIDSHPGEIFHRRLGQIPSMLKRVSWDGDQAIGFN